MLGAGLAFLAVLLYFTAGIQFNLARDKVVKRLLKTVALRQVQQERGNEKKGGKRKERRRNEKRKKKNSTSAFFQNKKLETRIPLIQVLAIAAAMSFVRFGLEPLCKVLRTAFNAQGPWVSCCFFPLGFSTSSVDGNKKKKNLNNLTFSSPPLSPFLSLQTLAFSLAFFLSHNTPQEKSSEYYILREVYRPLEFLFSVAAVTTLAENFLPQLIALPKAMVQTVVRSTLSLTFVLAAARVVFNIKGRVTREAAWKLELSGDLTKQRRVEAVDKLLSVLFLLVTSVFGLQAVGLDVNSVLAIGGVGGLAVGLAGREILENLFTGLIILSSSPFEVGDEVQFTPPSGGVVEGIVIDVGWYRTTIRSFEREVFNIPNSVFSRNVVLNVTRKAREWRFYERLYLRVEDAVRCPSVVADMRKVLRADPRIIHKLHRRVFLERVDKDQSTVYVSFYVEAANRDQFMAIKQDLLLAFLDCVEQNGAALARNRLVVAVEAAGGTTGLPLAAALALPAARGGLGFSSSSGGGGKGGGGAGSGAISTPAAVATMTTDAATQTTTTAGAAPSAASPAVASAPVASSTSGVIGPAVDVASNVVPKGTATTTSSKPAVAAAKATATTATVATAAKSGTLPDDVMMKTFDGGSVINASFDEIP